RYPMEISRDNPTLKLVRLIASTSSRRGVRVLFYITPIHVQQMRTTKNFDAAAFHRSLALVMEQGSIGTTRCVNLVDLLDESDFADGAEHYKEEGQRKLALALLPQVGEILLESQWPNPEGQ
ncbi:MAG: hypothetical protein JSV16_10575, partial [Candidatus Hydrogenedentota bacterium]